IEVRVAGRVRRHAVSLQPAPTLDQLGLTALPAHVHAAQQADGCESAAAGGDVLDALDWDVAGGHVGVEGAIGSFRFSKVEEVLRLLEDAGVDLQASKLTALERHHAPTDDGSIASLRCGTIAPTTIGRLLHLCKEIDR